MTDDAQAGRRIEYVRLSDLVPDEANPKAHDVDTVTASVARFGYIDPIVRDERTGKVVSGHGRLTTLRRLEETRKLGDGAAPDGIRVDPDTGDWLAPVVTGWSSRNDVEARAALVALNRTTTLGGWVDDALLSILDDLAAEGDAALDGVGFDTADIDALRDRLKENDSTDLERVNAPGDFPEYDEDIPTDYVCPSCGFRWSGSASAGDA